MGPTAGEPPVRTDWKRRRIPISRGGSSSNPSHGDTPYSVLDRLGDAWKYGVFIVPRWTGAEVAIASLSQSPYPWGELHISCTEFKRMTRDQATDCLTQTLSLPPQVVVPLSIEKRAGRHGTRNNLVLSLLHRRTDQLNTLLAAFAQADGRGIKAEQRATLWYGLSDADELDDDVVHRAIRELESLPWEATLVARMDDPSANRRTLRFIGPTLGVRSYALGLV